MDLAEIFSLLTSETTIQGETARELVNSLDLILRDPDAECDFDDAWDTLDLLGPRHGEMLLKLSEVIADTGNGRTEDADCTRVGD